MLSKVAATNAEDSDHIGCRKFISVILPHDTSRKIRLPYSCTSIKLTFCLINFDRHHIVPSQSIHFRVVRIDPAIEHELLNVRITSEIYSLVYL